MPKLMRRRLRRGTSIPVSMLRMRSYACSKRPEIVSVTVGSMPSSQSMSVFRSTRWMPQHRVSLLLKRVMNDLYRPTGWRQPRRWNRNWKCSRRSLVDRWNAGAGGRRGATNAYTAGYGGNRTIGSKCNAWGRQFTLGRQCPDIY